jgi:hypothetical protein
MGTGHTHTGNTSTDKGTHTHTHNHNRVLLTRILSEIYLRRDKNRGKRAKGETETGGPWIAYDSDRWSGRSWKLGRGRFAVETGCD